MVLPPFALRNWMQWRRQNQEQFNRSRHRHSADCVMNDKRICLLKSQALLTMVKPGTELNFI